MEYEIIKTEGLGRIGLVSGKQKFTTPTLIKPIFFESEEKKIPSLNKEFPNVISSLNSDIYPSSYSVGLNTELLPVILVYPSLQAQGKSISDISYLSDLFPEHSIFKSGLENIYHLIYSLLNKHIDAKCPLCLNTTLPRLAVVYRNSSFTFLKSFEGPSFFASCSWNIALRWLILMVYLF